MDNHSIRYDYNVMVEQIDGHTTFLTPILINHKCKYE
jgi:hypothetical protein